MEKDKGQFRLTRREFILGSGLVAVEFGIGCSYANPQPKPEKIVSLYESQLFLSEPKDGSAGRYSIALRENALLEKILDRHLLPNSNVFELGFTPRSSTSTYIVAQIIGKSEVIDGWTTIFDGYLSKEHRVQTLWQNWKFIDVLVNGKRGKVAPLR